MNKIIAYIYEFFTFIGDIFEFIYDLGRNILGMIVDGVKFVYGIASALPTFLIVGVLALVAVAAIYKLVGREGQD